MLRQLLGAPKIKPPFGTRAALIGVGLVVTGTALGAFMGGGKPSADDQRLPACTGEFSDSLETVSTRMRAIEQGPNGTFTYLVRSTARYECPFFAPDGKLRRKRVDVTEHGTAFAYENHGDDTFLLTNEHVAVWPEVTEPRHKVEGVGDGCRKMDESLRIVHDEQDEYEPTQIELQRVAYDPRLDAAILKASRRLPALPYRVGKSASLRQGNAVQVRGFPLGLIHAVNAGKVVNPYDRDLEQGWDHVDFVIDALLAEGNSGSPVLALSCRTRELELVGMYHAGYKGASALNVVVGIDQLRDFMLKKKRMARPSSETGVAMGAGERKRLEARLKETGVPLFQFGGLTLLVESSPGILRYHVFGRRFPLDDRRLGILDDRPTPGSFGTLGPILIRGDTGFRAVETGSLGEEDQELTGRFLDAVRAHLARVLEYRRALSGQGSADERRRGRELQRTIERVDATERELAGQFVELAERLSPARPSATPDAGAAAAPVAVVPALPTFWSGHPAGP